MEFILERPEGLTWYQKQFLNDPARYAVMEAATKTGKTTALIQWMIEQAMQRKRGQACWWLAPTLAQTDIAFKRSLEYLRQIGTQAQKQGFSFHLKVNSVQKSIEFLSPVGGTIVFRTADNADRLYGEDVYSLVCDEATRMKRESWTAARSTLTKTRGKARIIANVKGTRNWVADLKKEAAYSDEVSYYKVTFLDAVKAGLHPMAEYEDAKKRLPHDDFMELYMCEPRADGSNPFKHDALEQIVQPISQNAPIYFGVDFARKQDYTAVIGLDYLGQVAYFDRFGADKGKFSYEDITDRVGDAIANQYAVCDGTGIGDALIETLAPKVGGAVVDTFLFTNKSKVTLIESLAVAIQNQEIKIPSEDTGGKLLFDELYNFEATYSPTGLTLYNAPEGQHDDCVIALALAWRCYKTYCSNQAQGSSILYIGEV